MNFAQRSIASSSIRQWLTPTAVTVVVLTLAFLLGWRASPLWLGLLLAAAGGLALLARPVLGLPTLVIAALFVPLEIKTGTYVTLNAVALLIPTVAVVWLLNMVRHSAIHTVASETNRPLLLFLAASLLSLLIGRATWDPMIPLAANFLLVQLGQWAIIAFSALAFWLMANLVKDERSLRNLSMVFLLLGGGLAILRLVPEAGGLLERFVTAALGRAPFWVLLVVLAGGQLLFNRELTAPRGAFLVAVLGAALVYAFVDQRDATSNWVGIGAALGVLTWLRFPRLRWPLVIVVVIMIGIGVLFPAVYNFAGGDDAWVGTGAPRLVLIERVVSVTMRNPITGLGPAAYRPYANATPLQYLRAYWTNPAVNSHNNYVDLFAHGGLLGLALFGWFVVAFTRTALRLRRRYTIGFAAGYLNAMLAAGAGSLVLMLFADWILPFVYNIGFPGFQASVLVWLFLGGVVALEHMDQQGDGSREQDQGERK